MVEENTLFQSQRSKCGIKKPVCFGLILIISLISWWLSHAYWSSQPSERVPQQPRIADRLNCSCKVNRSVPQLSTDLVSTCGAWATARGPHQQVVSFSIFGHNSTYFRGISLNAQLVLEHYPGWCMRVYYHFSQWTEAEVRDKLCPLWCDFPHLDFCAVEHLPPPLLNQSGLQPRMWRFLVLGDPTVDRFLSRDVDSLISAREVAAVDEWMRSGKTFHFMRDHFLHNDPIPAGMWGAVNTDLKLTRGLRNVLVRKGKTKHHKFQDQYILTEVVLPIAEKTRDYINHDSYHCLSPSPKMSWPWPTQREDRDFVGNPVLRVRLRLMKPCPPQCRPRRHKDWTYC